MQDGALDNALEGGRRLHPAFAVIDDEAGKLLVNVAGQVTAKCLYIHLAGPHDFTGVLIFGERQKEMLKRGVLMIAFGCEREGLFESRFERG